MFFYNLEESIRELNRTHAEEWVKVRLSVSDRVWVRSRVRFRSCKAGSLIYVI